ncbi:ABC transporter permease [Hyalangium rubrum]|uniref:ABC transporter permease n=1 Tax=Hyalangium rubrum TaxID=3103134 RepID=A0ABU5H9M3_9BACT|nr:ABC transporter permease [Hyalangium sp. s54d21]MDY7228805.1 ABC transporter permease [Hyalangium sp. s54d21]
MRFGLRLLRKHPTFAVVIALTLGLGIGLNTAIFSIADAIYLRAMRFPGDESLVMVWETSPERGIDRSETSFPTLKEWQSQAGQVLAQVAGFTRETLSLTKDAAPEQVPGSRVGAQLFSALGARPLLGRGFEEAEAQVGAEPVVVLSHALWRRRFGEDPSIVGRSITLDGQPRTVVGVMAADFQFPPSAELWVPLVPTAREAEARGLRKFQVLARLRSGVTPEQAKSALQAVSARMEQEFPDEMAQYTVRLTGVREAFLGPIGPVLMALGGAVGFVLLIACANVANLLLARAAGRGREIAVRAALGAGRRRIAMQMLVESVLLALVGGMAGVCFAVWGTDLLTALMPDGLAQRIPGWTTIGVNVRVLLFSLGLSLMTGLIFGLMPALRVSRTELAEVLKDSQRTTGRRGRMSSALVVGELSLALVLLVGAGLMLQSFQRLQRAPTGFDASNVLAFPLTLPEATYPDDAARTRFYTELMESLSQLPGLEAAGAASLLPLSRSNQTSMLIFPDQPAEPGREPHVNHRVITPGYLRTMSIPLLRGRDLGALDGSEAPRVALVNEEMARRFWPGEEALGKRFFSGGEVPWEVVGVVGNTLSQGRGQFQEAVAEFYVPQAQEPRGAMQVVVRARGPSAAVTAAVREAVARQAPDLPVGRVFQMEQLVDEALGPRRMLAGLVLVFAAAALTLAAVGVFGVMSYMVEQRTREMGVRLALGATPKSILMLVLRHALRLALLGITIGTLVALGLARLLAAALYNVSPADPITFTLVALLLMVVTMVASYLPAWRATRVPPAFALQAE